MIMKYLETSLEDKTMSEAIRFIKYLETRGFRDGNWEVFRDVLDVKDSMKSF